MLDESEWLTVTAPWAGRPSHEAAQHSAAAGAKGLQARREWVVSEYREITGSSETNAEAIMHHRLADYGPPCAACGKPLRTMRASFCAACGKKAEQRA
jgi:hypothetical protein